MRNTKKLTSTATDKLTAPVTVKLPGNGIFYKFLWYSICLFIISLFVAMLCIKQLTDKPDAEVNTSDAEGANKPDMAGGIQASFHTFFDGTYQEFYENKLLEKPFIADLNKYKNKYEYLLFDKVNLADFYAGKENYIFGETMTKAYFGDDYYGEETIKNEVQKAKFVQDKLKGYGIALLIMFAPGKSSIYPEFLPGYILKTKKKTRNYETYVRECKNQHVNFIDFVNLFTSVKDTVRYPLFTKYGSHWSYYSECNVVDTTIKKLENLMNDSLPHLKYIGIALQDTPQHRDADILKKMLIDVPGGNKFAYPENIGYRVGLGIKPQKILAIGDSYFQCFFYINAFKIAFDNSELWYYYNSIIPERAGSPEVWELDLKSEILKNKAVVILCNEMNLKNLGDGFIDDAYQLFNNPSTYYANKKETDELNRYKKEIRKDKEILAQLSRDARQKGIALDSLITEAAIKLKFNTSGYK